MTADQELSLAHHFADLTDPRIDRSRLHELLDIVAIAICAVVAGADSWDDIEDFGKVKHDWLKTFLDLPNGIPSHDTFRRLFERLDPDEFQRGFLGWIEALHEATERPGHRHRRQDPAALLRPGQGPSRPCTWSTPGPRPTTCCWARWPWTRSPTRSRPSPSS